MFILEFFDMNHDTADFKLLRWFIRIIGFTMCKE